MGDRQGNWELSLETAIATLPLPSGVSNAV